LSKRLLLVAYPLLPVSENSAGGAEQILWTLERELAARGWPTTVAASSGSKVAGKLIATDVPEKSASSSPRQGTRRAALTNIPVGDNFSERAHEHAERVILACVSGEFDLVLDHSGHFFRHAGRVKTPVLATLHLPRELYEAGSFDQLADNVIFNCVSESQRREFMDVPRVTGVVRNGIAVERFGTGKKADFVLWLGRVCPEKAPHLAIRAARKAGLPIVVAGQVYPFRWHQEYWEREVKPLFDGDQVRWISLPSFEEKAGLLRKAKALLVTSKVSETTSLVALEAMASGTPVIAFNVGALSEVVSKGTGFLVNDVNEMAQACAKVDEISPQNCRDWVAREYSATTMAGGYERLILTQLEIATNA